MKKWISALVVTLLLMVCFGAASLAEPDAITLTITPDTGLLVYDPVTCTVEANGATDLWLVCITPDGHEEEWDMKELGAKETDGKWILNYSFWYTGDVSIHARVSFDNGTTWVESNAKTLNYTLLGFADLKMVPDADTVVRGEKIVIRFLEKEHVYDLSEPTASILQGDEYIPLTNQPKMEMTEDELTFETDDLVPGVYRFDLWTGSLERGYYERWQKAYVTVIDQEEPLPAEWQDETGSYTISPDGTAAFAGPVGAPSAVTIPAAITVNGKKVRVTAISDNAFRDSEGLQTVTVGKYVSTIGKNAFVNNAKLTTVKGCAAVKVIQESAFSGCKALKTFPTLSKLQKIGANAFKGCVKLTKFTLSKSVTKIGKNAFNGCGALKTITVKTEKLTTKNVGTGAFKGIAGKATFTCPKKLKDSYRKLFIGKGAPKTCTVK